MSITAHEIVEETDAIRDNTIPDDQKYKWLSRFEKELSEKLYRFYTPDVSVTEDVTATTELSVPEAFSDLYVSYLASKIDYANGEIDRYNNDLQLFNYYKQTFEEWFNVSHTSNITAKYNAL